jgi:pantothenate synthetase
MSLSLPATFWSTTNRTPSSRLARDQDHAAVSDRIASLVDAERQADAKIDARFAELMENLEKGTRAMSRIEEVLNMVFSTA